MARCAFCGKTIEFGTGKTIISKTGKEIPLCSRTCEKHVAKGRKPRNIRWTRESRKK